VSALALGFVWGLGIARYLRIGHQWTADHCSDGQFVADESGILPWEVLRDLFHKGIKPDAVPRGKVCSGKLTQRKRPLKNRFLRGLACGIVTHGTCLISRLRIGA